MRSVSTFAAIVLGLPLCGALVACGSDDGSGAVTGKSGGAGTMGGSGGSEAEGAQGDPSRGTGGRAVVTDAAAGGLGRGEPSGGRVELMSGGQDTGGQGEGAGGATGGSGDGEPADGEAGDGRGGGGGAAGTSRVGETGGGSARSGQGGQGTGGQVPRGQGGTAGGAAGASGMAEPGGGGAIGQAGQGAAGNSAVDGLPGASSFTSLTIRSQATMDWGREPSECDPYSYESVWTFDRAIANLTWDWCRGYPGTLERGSKTLSDAAVQATLNTVSRVTLSTEGDCLADADAVELELEVDGEVTLYHSDYGWCGSGPNASNYVNGLDLSRHWLECLTGVEVPDTPETLTLSTGHPPEDPPANSDCLAHLVPQDYELDVASRALSWRSCTMDAETGEYVASTDGRVLDAAELDAVLDAYHQLDLGASGPCESYESLEALHAAGGRLASVTIDGSLYLFDEAASCGGGAGGGFAIGVAALAHLVDDLAG